MKVVLHPCVDSKKDILQITVDTTKNLLLLRMMSQDLLVIQLIGDQAYKSTIIERIRFHQPRHEADQFSAFAWIEHLNCYLEGTNKGYLRLRKVDEGGICFITLDSKSCVRINTAHYSKRRGLLFVSSEDGIMNVWKLPDKWRDEKVDQMETDYIIERKSIARQSRVSDAEK